MAQYEKVFTKPYEDGYEDLPSQNTPITAQTLNDKDTAIEHIENFLDGQEFLTALADLTDDETHRLVTDTEIAEWNNKIDSTAVEEQTTTTGQFTTKTGGKFESCIVSFEPVQSGSGDPSPDNVRPITGHSSVEVNIYGENFFADLTKDTSKGYKNDYYLTSSGNNSSNSGYYISEYLEVRPSTEYYIAGIAGNAPSLCFYDINKNFIQGIAYSGEISLTVTTPSNAKYMRLSVIKSNEDLYTVRYPESCEVTVNLGGTYYGGTLDVVSGVLTVTHQMRTIGSMNWTFESWANDVYSDDIATNIKLPPNTATVTETICECYKSESRNNIQTTREALAISVAGRVIITSSYTDAASFKTAMSDKKICYPLATPTTIQLTPQQINTLIGENNIDVPLTGQSLTSAVYRELFAWDDVEDVVNTRLPISAIGTDESNNDTASQAYSQGDYFYKNGIAKAKTSIASGATFTLGTNYEIKTLAEILKALES